MDREPPAELRTGIAAGEKKITKSHHNIWYTLLTKHYILHSAVPHMGREKIIEISECGITFCILWLSMMLTARCVKSSVE